jgi:hypothetical protein
MHLDQLEELVWPREHTHTHTHTCLPQKVVMLVTITPYS